MTTIPVPSGDSQPPEWNVGSQTLIVSAGGRQALAVLNARYPLLLPPGSVLQFDGPPGELVVTGIRVIAGQAGGIVCAETEPARTPGRYRASTALGRPAQRPGHLRTAPDQPPRWSPIRPGNG
jgi:hypothetical protein